jgi:preprotein translocase subunit SecB
MASAETESTRNQEQPGIAIVQVFLERANFEHRRNPLLVTNAPPAVGDVNIQVESGLSSDQKIGATRVTVSTKPENEPTYDVSLTMVGIFARDPNFADGQGMPLDTFIQHNSVSLLYPFVREAFANLTQRGRFGAVWLNAFNTRANRRYEVSPDSDHASADINDED